jgi:hypothetical protein
LGLALEHFGKAPKLLSDERIAAVVGGSAAVLSLAEKILLGGHDRGPWGVLLFVASDRRR